GRAGARGERKPCPARGRGGGGVRGGRGAGPARTRGRRGGRGFGGPPRRRGGGGGGGGRHDGRAGDRERRSVVGTGRRRGAARQPSRHCLDGPARVPGVCAVR